MKKHDENGSCCEPLKKGLRCCKVESVISVDDRGQMVLPKELRERAAIHGGDKLAVVSWEKDDKVCCISLIKVEDLEAMVKGLLGPVVQEIISSIE